MNKKILLPIFAFLLLMVSMVNVNAASLNVKTLEVSIKNNILDVSGTTDNGVLAVTVMVYDENETNLITMETTAVDSSNKYSKKINLTDGKYIVKTANYDGGDYLKKSVEPQSNSVKNPQTYDGIMTWIVIGLVSVSGIVGTIVYRKKKNI